MFNTFKTGHYVFSYYSIKVYALSSTTSLGALMRILRYICETMAVRVYYHKVQDCNLFGYSNSDCNGLCDKRKITLNLYLI